MQILANEWIWMNSFWDNKIKRRTQRFIFRYTFSFQYFLFVFCLCLCLCLGMFVCHRSNCYLEMIGLPTFRKCHPFFFFRISHIKFIVVILWFHFIMIRMQVHSKSIFNVNVKRMFAIMELNSEFYLPIQSHHMNQVCWDCFFAIENSVVAVSTENQTNKLLLIYDEQTLRDPNWNIQNICLSRETRNFKWKKLQTTSTIFDYTQKLTLNVYAFKFCLLAVGCWPKFFA